MERAKSAGRTTRPGHRADAGAEAGGGASRLRVGTRGNGRFPVPADEEKARQLPGLSFPAACRFDAALRDRPDGIGRPVGAAYFFVALSGSA
jgi:hypothetical protein